MPSSDPGMGSVTTRPTTTPSAVVVISTPTLYPTFSEQPTVSMVPTKTPSEYPTIDPINRTFQPTIRTLPLRPTLSIPSSNSPSITTSAPSTSNSNSSTQMPTILTVGVTMTPTTISTTAETGTDETTPSPTIDTTQLEALIQQRSSDNGVAFTTPGTPQKDAFEWISTKDVYLQQQNSDNFVSIEQQFQRYNLATFYYSTGGEAAWEPVAEGVAKQDDTTAAATSSWLSATNECDWKYIICNENQEIVALEIISSGGGGGGGDSSGSNTGTPDLTGTLPPELGLLTMLSQLVLSNGGTGGGTADADAEGDVEARQVNGTVDNALTGPLPSELGLLEQLVTLNLEFHDLTGTIPIEISTMVSLESLDLSSNIFTGPLPTANLPPAIKQIRLGTNRLQLNLGTEIGLAQGLTELILSNNLLTGEIPSELGLLTGITTGIFLDRNRFSGTLPTELGSLSTIQQFRVDANGMTGDIPEEFSKW